MKILIENSTDIEMITESVGNKKKVIIKGIFASAEVKNKNKRIYSSAIMDREAKSLNEKIKEMGLIGALDHPPTPDYNLKDAAISIKAFKKVDDKNYYGEAVILEDTPGGKIAKNLYENGIKFGTSLRGVGDLKLNEDTGVYEVMSNYKLITIDLVSTASNPASKVMDAMYE